MIDYRNDFYSAINYDWLVNKHLEDGQSYLDNFLELSQKNEKYIRNNADDWLNNSSIPQGYGLENFISFYHQATDFKKRERLGVQPLLEILEEYISLLSFEDYVTKLAELELKGLPNLLPFYIAPDLISSRKNAIWFGAPGLTFPDASYYKTDEGVKIINQWHNCQKRLLEKLGFSDEEANEILIKVIELDKMVIDYLGSSSSNNAKYYNFDEVQQYLPSLPLKSLFMELAGNIPSKIIVSEGAFLEQYAQLFYSEELWGYLKAKLIYGIITMYSSCLTDEINVLASEFRSQLQGIENIRNKNQDAYDLTQFVMGQDLSYWYAKQLLSDGDKENINKLFDHIKTEFKLQVSESTNLTVEGRQNILEKLDNLYIQIGGPEKSDTNSIDLSLSETLVNSVNLMLENKSRNNWSKWSKRTDREAWTTPSFVVDAYYNTSLNRIMLPAGILQKPFYSEEYSFVKNISRIGFLIAHEISHAFDNEGCLFDKSGNYKKWLPTKDEMYFQEIHRQAKIKYRDQTIDGHTVNVERTLSENIADLIGFSCIEKIIYKYYPQSLKDFYAEFTKLWRIISRPEYTEMIIATDSHLPNKLRVNNMLSNSELFLTYYQINSTDKMWVEPNNRITIW